MSTPTTTTQTSPKPGGRKRRRKSKRKSRRKRRKSKKKYRKKRTKTKNLRGGVKSISREELITALEANTGFAWLKSAGFVLDETRINSIVTKLKLKTFSDDKFQSLLKKCKKVTMAEIVAEKKKQQGGGQNGGLFDECLVAGCEDGTPVAFLAILLLGIFLFGR